MPHKLTSFLSTLDIELIVHTRLRITGGGAGISNVSSSLPFYCVASVDINIMDCRVTKNIIGNGYTPQQAVESWVDKINTAFNQGKKFCINHPSHIKLSEYSLDGELIVDVSFEDT